MFDQFLIYDKYEVFIDLFIIVIDIYFLMRKIKLVLVDKVWIIVKLKFLIVCCQVVLYCFGKEFEVFKCYCNIVQYECLIVKKCYYINKVVVFKLINIKWWWSEIKSF